MTKKSICARLSTMVSPPQKTDILCLLSYFSEKEIQKKFKKNALDIIRALFKDESIAIDIVPQLEFFLDFSRGFTPFCSNKGLQRLYPCQNFFCCEPLKC